MKLVGWSLGTNILRFDSPPQSSFCCKPEKVSAGRMCQHGRLAEYSQDLKGIERGSNCRPVPISDCRISTPNCQVVYEANDNVNDRLRECFLSCLCSWSTHHSRRRHSAGAIRTPVGSQSRPAITIRLASPACDHKPNLSDPTSGQTMQHDAFLQSFCKNVDSLTPPHDEVSDIVYCSRHADRSRHFHRLRRHR